MWEVDLELIRSWLDTLDENSTARIFAALEQLRQEGPTLGRPLVDTLTGSRASNMKELRPASPRGSEIRILFVFDSNRTAIMLVGGDKASGKNKKAKWSGWYRRAIPKAERLYAEHLKELEDDD